MSKAKISVYDTTLRDGTQGEGVSFSVTDKLRIAEKFDQFGIDYIEGGWPGSNPRDMAFFEEAKSLKLKHAKIAAFGSTRRANLSASEDPQLQTLLDAETPVVTIFGKTWLLHVTEVLRVEPEENLRMIEDSVRFLKENGREVVYDAEHFYDGYADSPEYALKTLEAAVAGGADCLALCDTNGGMMVGQLTEITKSIVERFPDTQVGVHCHNDSGVGVALSLSGIEAGAVHVQGTFNGYGERVGNANLTTIIPNLSLKLGYEMNCGNRLEHLRGISMFLADLANLSHDNKAPYVGLSAFTHKGGAHADATKKVSYSYEHVDPTKVGNKQRVLVSDMAGRSSLLMKAQELGVNIDRNSPETKAIIEKLKELEFNGYEYESADASLRLLLDRFMGKFKPHFEFESYRVIVEKRTPDEPTTSEATIKVNINGEPHYTVAESSGPVGALDKALRIALSKTYPNLNDLQLKDYKVRILASQSGTDAKTRVLIESADGKELWGTVGASDNIIEASWQAIRDSVEYKLLLDGQ
ncbi:MAG: citramalate synthase [Opitutales bacterium]|jgi:2-isopropylmalate synthase|nr:citramalate synthase [Opitutales bacterium]MBT5170037.1 citramalate synthase [Opitutales bacterium]MBT5814620.1 citramalate synthase [Opitutales bacterium]MBT6379950.1 citramalate synthase [Opitutales bacterium]